MNQKIKFEEAFFRLEEIVKSLEDGNLPLDESLKLFEEGIGLLRACSKKLEEAERKVEVLVKGEGGAEIIKPFDEFAPEPEEDEQD